MWVSKAPSNIALIKYMGKEEGNIPSNISLSYTLEKFITEVTLEENQEEDIFVNHIGLGESEIKRFLSHLDYIKKLTNFIGYFKVTSKSNFPRSAGIASSASSFAALTMCALKAIGDIKNIDTPSIHDMSAISRRGSGSSCRSFFSPWCVWKTESAEHIDISINELLHDVVLIDNGLKKTSSSEAHRLVRTSLLFDKRKDRAQNRFDRLVFALNNNQWNYAYQICWEEFFDMHSLFETSAPHFGYITAETMFILSEIQNFWNSHNDGPIVTIDAGPNVHLLWRRESEYLRSSLKQLLINSCSFDINYL